MVNVQVWIWIAVIVVLAVIEAATMDLVSIWVMFGGLIALIFAALGASIVWQIFVCLLVSIILLIFTRPLVVEKMKVGKNKTNADSLIGEICIVSEDVNNYQSVGRAKIKGQSWSARSIDDEVEFETGEKALIKEISGVKLIIEKV